MDIVEMYLTEISIRREANKNKLKIEFLDRLKDEQIEKIVNLNLKVNSLLEKKRTSNLKTNRYKKAERLRKILKNAKDIHDEISQGNVDHLFLKIRIGKEDEDEMVKFDTYEYLMRIAEKIAEDNLPKILKNSLNSVSELKEKQIFDAKLIYDACEEFGLAYTFRCEIITCLTGLDKKTIANALSENASYLHPLKIRFSGSR